MRWCLLAMLLLLPVPAAADRLHMKNGWDFDVDAWREEGDFIVYERFGGEVRVPKGDVLRVEKRADKIDTMRQAPVSGPSLPVPIARPPAPDQKAGRPLPENLRDELKRLREAEAQAQLALIRRQTRKSETELALMRAGGSPRWANASAAEIHDKRIEELERERDDARRRLLDFESQLRVQYGELPRE